MHGRASWAAIHKYTDPGLPLVPQQEQEERQTRENRLLWPSSFIDARKLGSVQVARTQIAFTDAEINRIAQTYHSWRGTRWSESEYQDVPGFCRSVPLSEVSEHGYVLTPGRYVGAEDVEDNDEDFATKMQELTLKLGQQMTKVESLHKLIRQKVGGLGYEF